MALIIMVGLGNADTIHDWEGRENVSGKDGLDDTRNDVLAAARALGKPDLARVPADMANEAGRVATWPSLPVLVQRARGLDALAMFAWPALGRPVSTPTVAGELGASWQPEQRQTYRDVDAPDLRAIICAPEHKWGWLQFENGCAWATSTVMCESGGNPNAYNPAGPYIGLWQVLNGPWDPLLNTVEASIQFSQWQAGIRTVSPWPSCSPYTP